MLVLLPVLFELTFVYKLSTDLNCAESSLTEIMQERDTLIGLHKLQVTIIRTTISIALPTNKSAAYLLPTITQQSSQIAKAQESFQNQSMMSSEINEVVKETEAQLQAVRKCLDNAFAVIKNPEIEAFNRYRYIDPLSIISLVRENRKLSKKIDALQANLQERGPKKLEEIRSNLLIFLSLGIAFSTLLSLILSRAFARDVSIRLEKIAEQAENFFQGKPLSERQKGTDEIAELEKTFLESAEILRETRMREQAILDNAADVICSIDAKYRFAGVGASAEKCWNRLEFDLLGAPVVSILDKDSIAPTLDAFRNIATKGTGEFENRIAVPNKGLRDFHWSVKWSAPERLYFCTVHDVTELRAVERMKERFLSIVSHDLRAPITSVGISLQLLAEGRRGELSDKAVKAIVRAEKSLSTLTVLVNELLDLDKIAAGKMPLNNSAVSAYEVCKSSCEAMAGLAAAANITLELSDTSCLIWADKSRLTQAVNNLVSNAIKFSPAESTVKLQVVALDDYAELQVIDHGPGVSPEEKAFIFEKYRQTSVQSNLKVKGSGLGLAIVKAIAEAHNGSAGIHDGNDGGSVFYIRIPRLTGSLESHDL